MTTRDDERDLRERFASLRSEEAAGATPLARVLAASERPPRRRATLAPALAAATVVTVVGLLIGYALYLHVPPASRAWPLSLAEWTEPTAFLLRTPGRDFLSTVPTFARGMPAANRDASPNAPVTVPGPAK